MQNRGSIGGLLLTLSGVLVRRQAAERAMVELSTLERGHVSSNEIMSFERRLDEEERDSGALSVAC